MIRGEIMRMDEKAVSPVIGVILMVGITVILAAVIASYVFGMGSTVQRAYNVAFTASMVNSTHVAITFQGGPDVGFVTKCWANSTNSTADADLSSVTWGKDNVGKTVTVEGASGDVITVSCEFSPGTRQVVLTYTVK
ncbi:MAG: type IV pilin N-terminal domain-containing protein [Archaeoglobaceae archaeon]